MFYVTIKTKTKTNVQSGRQFIQYMCDTNKIKKIRGKAKKKAFRLSCRKLFLTYSQCEVPLSKVLEEIKIILSNYEVISYLLVREKHTEGLSLTTNMSNDNTDSTETLVDKGTHIHVYIETTKKMEIINPEKLDLYSGKERYHGNYQSAKNKEKVINYILKDVFDKNNENLLCSKDISSIIDERGAVLTYKDSMLKLAEEGKINEALELLKIHNIDQYIKSHASIRKSLTSLYIQKLGAVPRFSFKNFYVPQKLLEAMSDSKDLQKTLVLVGAPGTGKSQFILSYIREELKLEPLLVNDFHSIREFICGFHTSILLDDINLSKLTREAVLKLVDSCDETTFDVKFGTIRIPAKTPRFIVSNKSLSELISFKVDGAIIRRVVEIDIGNRVLFEVIIHKQGFPL